MSETAFTPPICERLENDAVCQNRMNGPDPLCREASAIIKALVSEVEASTSLLREVARAIGPKGWPIYEGVLNERADANDAALTKAGQ